MGKQYFLGIDIGTYESKGVIIDEDCHVIASHEVEHEMLNPAPNCFEHEPEKVWWGDFCRISRALLDKAGLCGKDIAAVGSSALGADLVPVDEHCVAMRNAILYGIDARAKEEICELNRMFTPEEILAFNGRPLCSNDIPPKMLWLKHHEPDIHERAYKLITGSTYLTAKLTGRYVVDRFLGMGAFAPLYHPETLQPWDRYVPLFCRADQLAEIGDTTDIAGTVTAQAAEATGLAEGTPVIVGADDSGAEAISTGVLEKGDLMLQIGSSLYLIGLTDKLIRETRCWKGGFLIPGTYSVQGGTNAAGTLTRWYRDQLFPDAVAEGKESGANAYMLMLRGLREVPPGSDGLLTLPYIAGERTPLNDPDARGVIFGLTIQHTRAHLYRSALESIGYSVRQHLEIFRENQVEINRIYVAGGGTKNELWMQIIADICGCRLYTAGASVGAAFGDAMMAAIGIGRFSGFPALREYIYPGREYVPNQENRAVYDRCYKRFCQLYRLTADMMHDQ